MATAERDGRQADGLLVLPPEWGPAARINTRWLDDERSCVDALLAAYRPEDSLRRRIRETAVTLIEAVRRNRRRKGGFDAFMHQYDLSSEEGVVLMCLAEALLRIPDARTADLLIADKLASGHWEEHLGGSDSLFVNVSTWGLMVSGRLFSPRSPSLRSPQRIVGNLAARLGEPLLRAAMRRAMRLMSRQFVMGGNIDEAVQRAADGANRRYRYSFDMLGEAALTAADAARYLDAYGGAIRAVGASCDEASDVCRAHGVSVKLSALYPRFEFAKREEAVAALGERLFELAELAAQCGIGLTVDAEEAERLELTLEIFEQVYRRRELAGWGGLGLAVQAYQKRAPAVVAWLSGLVDEVGEGISVRLVKGAYWDTEIKRAQEQGLRGYPVYTRKAHTDLSFLACARALLHAPAAIFPQFATHNAHAAASILHLAGDRDFEFQRLHGMGQELYEELLERPQPPAVRVYAPVGKHQDLLPYLVRRLLENGANTSFVNRIVDDLLPPEEIAADPVEQAGEAGGAPHPRIPLPRDLYLPARRNSAGLNLADANDLSVLSREAGAARRPPPTAPWIAGQSRRGRAVVSVNPARTDEVVGQARFADAALAEEAVAAAVAHWPAWDARPVAERAALLERAADLYEHRRSELVGLCVREGGKNVRDALAEVREAVDFLRYYAWRAREEMGQTVPLPGPTGERNELGLSGKGVFVCISPWNFPLAIFTGQVAAALVTGNCAVAKPAEQTPLIAARAVALLHEAGVPVEALHFLPGAGAEAGAAAVGDPRIAGVVFTGSTETARGIQRVLAAREGALATLIAETGGQNAMIVDSSALPEQVVLDVVHSAFYSAGQRCSALRVLYLQEDIAGRVIDMLRGHMAELAIGDPAALHTDVGPVIDQEARDGLEAHVKDIASRGDLIYRCRLPLACAGGTFVAPTAVEIGGISWLEREVFGPVLHVVRYRADRLDSVLDEINATGYGLTLGIHSRVESTARHIAARARIGNVYINRNQVGAVVGVQPFGGRGLSGTGPKAGGPQYLSRFTTEKVVTENTAAVGGNASLLALEDD